MTEKEILIRKLGHESFWKDDGVVDVSKIADYIIEDRKRIVEPLTQLDLLKPILNKDDEIMALEDAIRQTIKNAGIDEPPGWIG